VSGPSVYETYGNTPVFLAKPMNGVESFVRFAGISGNYQYLGVV
jgi:hypothetical protein